MPDSQKLAGLFSCRLEASHELLEITRRMVKLWDQDNVDWLLGNLAEREAAFHRLSEIDQSVLKAQQTCPGPMSQEMTGMSEATGQVLREINSLDARLLGDLSKYQNHLGQSLESISDKRRLTKSFSSLSELEKSKFLDTKT